MHYGGAQYGTPAYYGGAAYGAEVEGGVDMMRLLQVGLRRWKTVLLVTVLGVGLGLLYLLLATPVFRASTQMEMSVRKPRLLKESAVIEDTGRADQDTVFNTRLAKFRSRAMSERVMARYLSAHPECALSETEFKDFLEESTEWSVRRKTFIVEVSVDSEQPEFSQTIANLYAECATEMMIEENRASSDNAVSWLQQQADHQKAALVKAEQAIIDYRTQASLDLLRNQKAVSEETLVKLNETLVELESKLITDRSLRGYIDQIKQNPGAVETAPAAIANAEQLQELIASWWEAKLALSTLKERYTVLHPKVKTAEANLVQLRQRLDGYLTTISGTIANGVQLLENQVGDIRARIQQERDTVLALELKTVQAEGRLNTLLREREAADASYRSVLARIEESRMAADENTAVLKLLQAAELPDEPVSPRNLRVLALSIILGLMLGYGLAWVLELLEDKLAGVQDIERMGLDLLAVVPRQKVDERVKLAKVCLDDKFSHLTETFASLRTILTYEEARERYRVILVTSTQPAEGKTVTACNLAISMAQAGRKTLLIDFDLRRPRMRKIFDEQSKAVSLLHTLDKGLFDSFGQLPVSGGHEKLDIITSQPSDQISPAEIIGGQGPQALIAWARENYECVIIDTPPLGVVGDAQKIADFVDGVMLAARPGHTRKRALRHTAERMMAVNTNVIGVVLNNVQISRFMSYSSSYHHYNSYYSYGSYQAEPQEAEV